ncbi:MAG: hypothetical protein NWE83_07475 [Candidatus Bathyarchaeota archaeon]|nr:hypothetical protein [Candidatus Bathyarchaeota archaeon]
MKLCIDNVNLNSSSGPNSFGQKLVKYLDKNGVEFTDAQESEACLSFIFSSVKHDRLFQRLDGIYFNTDQDWLAQNRPIFGTYKRAYGIVFQSNFSKKLVTTFFGEHENTCVIHNGFDLEAIRATPPAQIDCNGEVWCCASSWRPHKRLRQNIDYFLQHSASNDILIVAGDCDRPVQDKKIIYIGNVSQSQLYALYKASTYFIHLGWLDNCPNVICDAFGCGCKIICSSSGGSPEVAGADAIVIREQQEWDFTPTKLYSPPPLNFDDKVTNDHNQRDISMVNVAKNYIDFIRK